MPWGIAVPLGAIHELGYEARMVPMDALQDLPEAVDLLLLQSPVSETALHLSAQARRRGVASIIDVDDLFDNSFLLDQLREIGRARSASRHVVVLK